MEWKPVYIKEQVYIESLYSFFIENKPLGFHFPGEIHDFWECRYILKGSICVSGDDKVYELSQGDLVFHKPMELHKFYIDNENGAELLIFSFNMKGPLTEYFKDKVFHLTDEQKAILERMVNFARKNYHNDENASFKKETRFLNCAKDTPLYLQRITVFLYDLLLSLGEKGDISEFSSTPPALAFQRAVNFMNEMIYEHPSVSEIAKHCYLSESGLKRLFANYAGIGIHKYFLKLKFKVASKLLYEGVSVREVSEKLNFSSQSYFSVAFKREFGINPSDLAGKSNFTQQ